MRTTILHLHLLAALAGALALPACSSAPPAPRERIVLAPCDIQLDGVPRVARQTPLSATLVFPFKVTNANEVSVLVERLKLDATINRSALGQNVCVPRAVLRPRETRVIDVNYDVSFIGSGLAVVEALGSGSATVAVAGDALVSCADRRYDAEPLGYPFQIK